MPKVKTKAKKSKRAVRRAKPTVKAGPHLAEVALAYLVKRTPRATEVLARVLGKSPGGVELLLKWCDGIGASGAARAAKARMTRLDGVLGGALRGHLSLDEAVWQAPKEAAPATSAPVSAAAAASSEPVCGAASPHSDNGDFRQELERALVSNLLKPM